MTIDLIKVSPTGYNSHYQKSKQDMQNGNNIIVIIGKQKQIRLMFHLYGTCSQNLSAR